MFIRNTKNVYISFVEESMIEKIAESKRVTYQQIRKGGYREKSFPSRLMS